MEKLLDTIIGGNLFRLRILRGLTQHELALITGISRSVISRYETGSVPLDVEAIYKFACALRVPVSCFYWTLR